MAPLLVDTDPQQSLTEWIANRRKLRAAGTDVRDLRHIYAPLAEADRAVREADVVEGVDLVIVDTPPGMDNRVQLRLLLERADLVIVPTTQSPPDTKSVLEMMAIATQLRRKAAFLIGKALPRWNSYRHAKKLLNRYGTLCPVDVRMLRDVERCYDYGLGINEAGDASGGEDFEGVWHFVRRELGC